MNYPETWFRGLDDKKKKEMFYAISSSVAIDRLIEIVEGFEKEIQINRNDYDNPSWSHRQAHLNGEIVAYKKILSLLRPKE